MNLSQPLLQEFAGLHLPEGRQEYHYRAKAKAYRVANLDEAANTHEQIADAIARAKWHQNGADKRFEPVPRARYKPQGEQA